MQYFDPYLDNVTITGNTATSSGGGIFGKSTTTITISNSVISNNTATDGGGIQAGDSYCILTIDHSLLSGNSATGTGGGIYFWSTGTAYPLSLNNVTITDNLADAGYGSGIYTSVSYTHLTLPTKA